MLPKFERRNHGSGVWFPDEIMDILTAIDAANHDLTQELDSPAVRLYQRGYEGALRAVALAFGLAYYPTSEYGPSAHVIAPAQLERR